MVKLLTDQIVGSLDPIVFPTLSLEVSKLVPWVKNYPGGRRTYIRDKSRKKSVNVLTHGNAINFQVICLVVIPIDGVLADNQSSSDRKRKLRRIRLGGQGIVNVVHGRDDSCEIGGSTREKECRILENLQESI